MTVLWEEDGKLAWLAGYQCLRLHSWIQGAILCLVVLHLWQVLHWRVAVGLLCVQRNLDVDHLAVSLDGSLFLCLAVSHGNVYEEIVALDRVLACLQLSEIILLDKFHYFCEEWIERNVFLQIV